MRPNRHPTGAYGGKPVLSSLGKPARFSAGNNNSRGGESCCNSRSKLALWSLPVALLAGFRVGSGAQPDFSKVEIKPHQVAGNVYYLEGQGGNVGVLVGDDGVLMIDDQFAPLTDKIMAAVKKLSAKPVRLLVNTHVHGDHTGGNENVGKLGIDILAHDNVRVRLAKGVNGGAPSPRSRCRS